VLKVDHALIFGCEMLRFQDSLICTCLTCSFGHEHGVIVNIEFFVSAFLNSSFSAGGYDRGG
jgi:hypothetical protein